MYIHMQMVLCSAQLCLLSTSMCTRSHIIQTGCLRRVQNTYLVTCGPRMLSLVLVQHASPSLCLQALHGVSVWMQKTSLLR